MQNYFNSFKKMDDNNKPLCSEMKKPIDTVADMQGTHGCV